MAQQETTNDGVYIVKALRDYLNKTWGGKPAQIQLERFDKNPPAITMQQLAGAFITRKYVDGSYIGSFPFAMYVRVNARSTKDTMDAVKALNDLYEWLIATDKDEQYTHLPPIDENTEALEFEMTSLPSLVATYDEGFEDYQALFRLNYKKRR